MQSGWIELIDTLWNVNTVTVTSVEGLMVELIDTLWNVNETIGGKIEYYGKN